MRNKILLCVFFVLLAYLIFSRFVIQFVWVNPNVNTKVLPYISKAVKEIDNALSHSVLAMKSEQLDVKILYKNAYGSGFLKNNSIPNDLDYSVGVYLGKYEFDGKNSKEIAQSINEKMSIFQTEFYNYINISNPKVFYSNFDTLTSLQMLTKKRENNIKSISASIPKLFNHEDYIVYTHKILYDNDDTEVPMVFPFILKKNEILIEDYSPIDIFSDIVSYSPNTRKMLREITVVTDFFVDIKQGDEIVRAEIVAESFTGQRLQLTRRFFVPIVFTGNSSAKYLKHLNILINDDDYIEYRLFNFRRHLQEFSNLKEMQERPIKLFKRVLQCTDLILPVLDQKTTEDIIATIEDNLNNPKIQLINDYHTAVSNLIQITSMPAVYLKAQYNNKITEHVEEIRNIVEEMSSSGLFKPDEIKLLKTYADDLYEKAKYVNSEYKLVDYNKEIAEGSKPVFTVLNEIVNATVTDMPKILAYIDTFGDIMKKAGFHKIDLCWIQEDLLGVVKDDFTSSIPEKELKNMAKANSLADVNYKFIDKSLLQGPKVRYSVWVRYNSTDKENEFWNSMKKLLLENKPEFNVKRRLIFTFN